MKNIVQNEIMDSFKRNKIQQNFLTWFSFIPNSSSRLAIFLVSLTQHRMHSLLNFFSLNIVLLLSSWEN